MGHVQVDVTCGGPAVLPQHCCFLTAAGCTDCHPFQQPRRRKEWLLWTACVVHRHKGWTADCFVRHWKRLLGKMSGSGGWGGRASEKGESVIKSGRLRRPLFRDSPRDIWWRGEKAKGRTEGRMSERSDRLHCLLMRCVCVCMSMRVCVCVCDGSPGSYRAQRRRTGFTIAIDSEPD